MRKKILHLLIPMSSQRATEEKGVRMKTQPKITGLKLRGLTCNQIIISYFIYGINQPKKLHTLGDFDNKTPTHLRIPRELDQTFYIPRFSVIYWVSSNNRKYKNRMNIKVIAILNPGIQPIYGLRNGWWLNTGDNSKMLVTFSSPPSVTNIRLVHDPMVFSLLSNC